MLKVLLAAAALLPVTGAPGGVLDELRSCARNADAKCTASVLESFDASRFRDCADCQELIARSYLLLRERRKALDAIERAIQLEPNRYGYLMTKGRINQRFDQQPPAIEAFLLAARIEPRNPETFYAIGMSFFLVTEFERAGRHFRHALDLDIDNDRAEFMLGVVDSFNSRIPEARAHMEKALALRPDNAYYHLHYGIVLARFTEEKDRALQEIEAAAKLDPHYGFTHYNLGRMYVENGNLQGAKREFEEATRLRPGMTSGWYQLAAVYRRLGDAQSAEKALAAFERLRKQDRERVDPVESAVAARERG